MVYGAVDDNCVSGLENMDVGIFACDVLSLKCFLLESHVS